MGTNRHALLASAFSLLILCPACGPERRLVREALDAIDVCYHWGGESGDQTEARNQEILEGVRRDCPIAKEKAERALRAYPENAELAAGILQLIDVGYFEVTQARQTVICTTAARKFTREFRETRKENVLFAAECAEQAVQVYGQ